MEEGGGGGRNVGLRFVRLKDKMGDWSNASSEVEYHGAEGYLVGEVGRDSWEIWELWDLYYLSCRNLQQLYRLPFMHILRSRKILDRWYHCHCS